MSLEGLKITQFDTGATKKILELVESFCNRGNIEEPPKFVIVSGGPAAGKTTARHQEFPTGYVHFDGGEIVLAMNKLFDSEDPKMPAYLSFAGEYIVGTAISEKKNIVIEIIGDDYNLLQPVIEKMIEVGYKVTMMPIVSDPMASWGWFQKATEEDPEYMSCQFYEGLVYSSLYQVLGIER